MLQTGLHLTCDGCGNPFPACGICPAPVDGAIYTPAMLRVEAKEEGWKRPIQGYGRIDLCPRCVKARAKKAGR